ncbi:E3 ubiquitin-protein ligase TRIM7-like [Elgaria multicarinata webbii]|uniref:E3 ubiquitin-protein ligase TRIM7-like n=1 Tax=Elgaria multicarinata webbii TaxID=159646 RepID=UPI002FCD4BF2
MVKRLQEGEGRKERKETCKIHQEPLNLFCKDDEALICLVCDRAKEHRGHDVFPLDEAALEYQVEIISQLNPLEKKRADLEVKKLAEELENQECLTQLETRDQKLRSDFRQMHRLLEKVANLKLAQLDNLKKVVKKRQQENTRKLSGEISHFSNLIAEMEEKCQQPVCELLQNIRITLNRYAKEQVRQPVDLSPGLEEILGTYSENSSVLGNTMVNFKESLESLEPHLYKVNVTLDPDTAHPCLILSEDLTSVIKGDAEQELPDKPGRFDVRPCVLGRERFTSGKHWWEVEVGSNGKGAMWAVGAARESVRRKGKFNFRLNPQEGIWAVGMITGELVAFTSPERTSLSLSPVPSNIRVTLDYEKGLVEFLDVERNELIFAFTASSFDGEKVCPYFWLGYRSQMKL